MPQRICPRLAFSVDRRHAADVPDADHVCTAQRPAQWLERARQAELCLTDAHTGCPRFIGHDARLAAHRRADAPPFQFVSSRVTVHPEPLWRGLAGRAAPPVGRRLAAALAGGSVAAIAAGAMAVAALPGPSASTEAGAERGGSPAPTVPLPVSARAPTSNPPPGAAAGSSRAPAALPAAPTPSPAPPTPTPAPPAPTAAPAEPVTYVVQAGDSLALIAERFGVTVEALQASNGIVDPDQIDVGQVLVIS